MEAATENRKRGRPKVLVSKERTMVEWVAQNARSERGKQNNMYAMRALHVLGLEDPTYNWLRDKSKMQTGECITKWGILSELGRFDDHDDMRDVAGEICRMDPKPKTKEAIAMIRRYRLGRSATGNAYDLLMVIARAIDDYRGSHSGITDAVVLDALQGMIETVEGRS